MCKHSNRIGDNYGLTCLDCGEVLEGYGYFGSVSRCVRHLWFAEGEYFICFYCERVCSNPEIEEA